MTKLRSELPPLIPRIAALPVDDRGYPIPFFVATIDGKPDFRIADPEKLARCISAQLCWVCGQKLGAFRTFIIGPMCSINRTSAEPPMHLDCAFWSVRGCPFLTRPNMDRREDELTAASKSNAAGIMIDRNPGVSAIWTCREFEVFPDRNRRPLFQIGSPDSITWWAMGRRATRAEVLASFESGLPLLDEACELEETESRREAAHAELARRKDIALTLIPKT